MLQSLLRRRFALAGSLILLMMMALPTALAPQTVFAQSAKSNLNQRPASTQSVNVAVSSDVVWQDTGISLSVGDSLQVSAAGSWTTDVNLEPYTGPDGYTQQSPDNFLNLTDLGACSSCASTPTSYWGALIGYIGSAPPAAGSYASTSTLPEAQKVFLVGSSLGMSVARAGELWLNINDDAYSANTMDNAGQVIASVTDTSAPRPLGGTWVSPSNNFTNNTGNTLHFSAHAYGGVGGVNHVNFTVWWPAIGNNPWLVACQVFTPTPGTPDVYECDWNLKDGNGHLVPNGPIKVGFDVYDNGKHRILSPNGVHSGTITAWTYDPGSYGGQFFLVSIDTSGIYNEPDQYPYRNYCGPGASRELISAWTSNVPSLQTMAAEELTDQYSSSCNKGKPPTGTCAADMVTPINHAIGQSYYNVYQASGQADFSNMIGKNILDNHHPLITGILTVYDRTHYLNGWNYAWIQTTHIITIYGFDFRSPSVGYIYYYETGGKVSGTTATGTNHIDYNLFWLLVQQNNVQLSGVYK